MEVRDEDKRIAWKSYYENLLNTECAWDWNNLSEADTVSDVLCLVDKYMVRSMQKVLTASPPLYRQPSYMANPLPPIWPTPIFSPNPPLLTTFSRQYHPNEIPNKRKKYLMRESYFFILRKLQNSITCFFVRSTFMSNARMGFNSK